MSKKNCWLVVKDPSQNPGATKVVVRLSKTKEVTPTQMRQLKRYKEEMEAPYALFVCAAAAGKYKKEFDGSSELWLIDNAKGASSDFLHSSIGILAATVMGAPTPARGGLPGTKLSAMVENSFKLVLTTTHLLEQHQSHAEEMLKSLQEHYAADIRSGTVKVPGNCKKREVVVKPYQGGSTGAGPADTPGPAGPADTPGPARISSSTDTPAARRSLDLPQPGPAAKR